MKMKIEKRFKGETNPKWIITTIEECLDKTEKTGYWKWGSVVEGLKAGLIVETPFAQYRCLAYTESGITKFNKF